MSETAKRIIAAAREWCGTPYRHQASLKGVGCDCLGLVRGVWRDVYGAEPETPPPYAADWAEASASETMVDAARRHCIESQCTDIMPGDLLLFRWRMHLPAKHAGIATPNGKMIHAQDGVAVTEIDLSPWWRRRLAYVFRFPELRIASLPLVGRAGVGVAQCRPPTFDEPHEHASSRPPPLIPPHKGEGDQRAP